METRVYLVPIVVETARHNLLTIDDDHFKELAELHGEVFSLNGFKKQFNEEEVDYNSYIRFLSAENAENVLVNSLELASDLAHNAMLDELGVSIDEWEDDEDVVQVVDGNRGYTDTAQDVFNRWYDYFLNHIEAAKI